MDKKRAFQILGLGENATPEEAKKAFRRLAKIHHPDNFAGNPSRADQEEALMKQINLAFHFLLPRLLSEKSLPSKDKDEPEARPADPCRASFFSAVFKTFEKGFLRNRGKKQQTQIRTWNRKRGSGINKGPGMPGPEFDQVFSRACRGSRHERQSLSGPRAGRRLKTLGKKRFSPRGAGPPDPGLSNPAYANFMKHMALKNCVESRTRTYDTGDPGSVEKIQPVKGVPQVTRRG
ncbi:J domain-containing protein [Desulfospira joergensenii]|uniref:J domain-containing protein n=1 Tax=Desulfospira joergensenii TaxID=53329 RepID=UPI0003B3506E|nr:J domain-containing protein [Desulfospira joergensenii]